MLAACCLLDVAYTHSGMCCAVCGASRLLEAEITNAKEWIAKARETVALSEKNDRERTLALMAPKPSAAAASSSGGSEASAAAAEAEAEAREQERLDRDQTAEVLAQRMRVLLADVEQMRVSIPEGAQLERTVKGRVWVDRVEKMYERVRARGNSGLTIDQINKLLTDAEQVRSRIPPSSSLSGLLFHNKAHFFNFMLCCADRHPFEQ